MQNKSIWRQEVHWKVSELCLLGGSMAVWLAGMACNIAVRLTNSGKMPVADYASDCCLAKPRRTSQLFTQPARLSLLWDRFAVGTWIVSIGDILMALGLSATFALCVIIAFRKIKEAKEARES